jgi:CheY-like chemotaxis protein
LDSTKWKVVTVHDGTDALNLLKIQNWDLVILDEELPRLSGSRCAMKFREWEKCHRINKQRNMVLASAYKLNFEYDADDEHGTKHVLLPFGFEHLVEKPYRATACEKFIQQTEENYKTALTGIDIIAH